MARKMIVLYAVMGGAALLLQVAFGGRVSTLFVFESKAHSPQLDIALGLILGLVVVVLWRLASQYFAWARELEAELRDMVAPIAPGQVAGIAAAGTLAEELFFRGFLQPHLGLVATSVLFGLMHRSRGGIAYALCAVVMGFAFGLLFEQRGSLIAPLVAHFTINLFNLHYLLYPVVAEEP